MKFNNNYLNQQRIVVTFAIFPITINGETRWLEKVAYMEEWYKGAWGWGWHKQKFTEDKFSHKISK